MVHTEAKLTTRILTPKGWSWLMGVLVFGAVIVPLLNTLIPADSALGFLHVSDRVIGLSAKFMCFAMVALAIDLIWGYTGILSLGHGFFFALGAYGMGMHLTKYMYLELKQPPHVFTYWEWKSDFPLFWSGFENFGYAVFMALLIPGLIAFVFGYFAFRSRIKGVYFAIITQALTYAMWQLFLRGATGFGGSNGLTGFKGIMGFSLVNPAESASLGLWGSANSTKLGLYIIAVVMLSLCFLFCRYIITSKLGRVLRAVRDAESRVMFSGYNTLRFKLFIWTVSALICAVAGIMYAPIEGFINPDEMKPINSIEMVVWVAVGGRGTPIGPMIGAGVVNGTKTFFSTGSLAEYWLYILGGLAVLVPLFFRGGLVDARSHEKIALGLSRILGSRSPRLTVPKLLPIVICLFVPSVFIVVLAELQRTGLIFTGVTYSPSIVSWLYVGLAALPAYVALQATSLLFRKPNQTNQGVIVSLFGDMGGQFNLRQTVSSIIFIGVATYAFIVAFAYSKPIGSFLLLLVMLLPLGIFVYRRELIDRLGQWQIAFLTTYLLLLILLALYPHALFRSGVYLGLLAMFTAAMMPFMPFVKSLLKRFSISKLVVVIVLIPIFYLTFFAAGSLFNYEIPVLSNTIWPVDYLKAVVDSGSDAGAFIVNKPHGIFLNLSNAMFGVSPAELSSKEMQPARSSVQVFFALISVIVFSGLVAKFFQMRKTAVGA